MNDWTQDPQTAEVAWYLKHGRYPKSRIKRDKTGKPYLIGDRAWNVGGRPQERVEERLCNDLDLSRRQATR